VEENGYFDPARGDYLNAFSHWINDPVYATPELSIEARKRIYKSVNERMRKHTLKTKMAFSKDLEKMFSDLGVPSAMSAMLARLYYTRPFQKYVIESGVASKMKKYLKLKKGAGAA